MSHKVFAERLDQLRSRLLEMSSTVEEAVQAAMNFTLQGEGDIEDIRKLDAIIDAEEVGIEEDAIELLALHQPMASDLRLLVAIIKINSDLERIGDHAINIAEANVRLRSSPQRPAMPQELSEMNNIALGMLRDALEALVHRNAEEAQDVRKRDDRVDRLHESVFRVMLTAAGWGPRRPPAGTAGTGRPRGAARCWCRPGRQPTRSPPRRLRSRIAYRGGRRAPSQPAC